MMPVKSRLTRLDAFVKTVEDARIRTRAGGLVTILSLLAILYLVMAEWAEYRRLVVLPELIVDKGRGERMEIHLNITFPVLPCELLTLDVMDVSGEQQTGVVHGVNKVRLGPASEGGKVLDISELKLHEQVDDPAPTDPSYCGDCYGAPPPTDASKPGCCNTCDDVREAYLDRGWAFGVGKGISQCEREHYAEKLNAQRHEGCRVEGVLRVNKVVGNFHIAPGRSHTNGVFHYHVLDNYFETPVPHTMSHVIHHLRFGPQLPEHINARGKWSSHWRDNNPLDNKKQETPDPRYNFVYFCKVVATSYLPLGWDSNNNNNHNNHKASSLDAPLGQHGLSPSTGGSLETHQYSVTSHKRSILGGDDAAEGHRERVHSQGGIPGVFFSYDISPMKVINRETRPKGLASFLTGVCAVIGGTLTVAAAVDRLVYEGANQVRKLHRT